MGSPRRAVIVLSAAALLAAAAVRDLTRNRTTPLWPALRDSVLRLGRGLPFELTDATRAAGLVHLHRKLVPHPSLRNLAPWLGSLGASVAVVDIDADGWPDVYLTNSAVGSLNPLFRNNGDGTFTDIARRIGLAAVNKDTGSLRALFFDCDNDGDKDLLLTTFHGARLHINDQGMFRDATAGSGLDFPFYAPASNVVDYDNDGLLDVVVGGYFSADNGGRARVFHNEGRGKFSPARGNLGLSCPRWVLAVGVYDLRGTGRPDLHFASDYNLNCLYFNDGRGGFLDASAELADTISMSNMSSEFADPFNDGRPSIFVANIHSPRYLPYGNLLWSPSGQGHYRDIAREAGVRECGWAWGAKFADLDNDTLQDLVVVNGYISGDPSRDYMVEFAEMVRRRPEYIADTRNWPAIGNASQSGYQRSCVYHNDGARFGDVAGATGMRDDLLDGRGVAAIDYRNDGSLSLVVANQGQPARFYRNRQRNRNRWVGFALRGTRSNRDAFGAEVTVRLRGGKILTRQFQPANGFMSQSDGRLHFGLGRRPVVESVEVRWPAGGLQRLGPVDLDRYHSVVEP